MSTIKVIHVLTRCDQGGSAEDTLALVSGCNTARYDLTLVRGLAEESAMSAQEKQAVDTALEKARKNGVRIIDMPTLVRRISPVNDLKTFRQLFLLFRKERPLIVSTHTSKAGLLGRWAAFFAGVPVNIYTPHGHVFHGYFNAPLTLLFKLLERLSFAVTDILIAVSDQEKKDYLENHVGSEDRIRTIYSAVNLQRFIDLDLDIQAKRRELGIPPGCRVVGTVGRLVTIKGPKYLIQAAAKVIEKIPQTVFVFVGDGELRPELEELATRLGIRENVLFAGWRSDVAEVMHTFDIFALPSLNEAMGKVLVEVMAAAKPVVASRVGGITNLVKDGETGYLVPPEDSEALAEKLLLLLEDESLAGRFGEAGKVTVYPKFDIETRIEKVESLYEELLVNKKIYT